MVTTLKDHSTTEIETTIGKALEELLGAPVSVNIQLTKHQRPEGIAAFVSNSKWSAQMEIGIADAPPEMGDDEPF